MSNAPRHASPDIRKQLVYNYPIASHLLAVQSQAGHYDAHALNLVTKSVELRSNTLSSKKNVQVHHLCLSKSSDLEVRFVLEVIFSMKEYLQNNLNTKLVGMESKTMEACGIPVKAKFISVMSSKSGNSNVETECRVKMNTNLNESTKWDTEVSYKFGVPGYLIYLTL